jgi:hypothetical protein
LEDGCGPEMFRPTTLDHWSPYSFTRTNHHRCFATLVLSSKCLFPGGGPYGIRPTTPQPHNIPITVGQQNIGPGAAPGPVVGRNNFVGSCSRRSCGPAHSPLAILICVVLTCAINASGLWAAHSARDHTHPTGFRPTTIPGMAPGPVHVWHMLVVVFYKLLGGMDHKQSLTRSPSWSKLSRGDKAALGDNSRDS